MAALVSSTSAALCWVISSIWRTATLTSSMAEACSRLSRAMSFHQLVIGVQRLQHGSQLGGRVGDELGAARDFRARSARSVP